MPVSEVKNLADTEPVVGRIINGKARAYPLRILTWHEIVNDELGGVPVAVTYCPLCNSAIIFDRRLDGKVLDFGTTGKLRHSEMVMYDRQTENWWQQFLGQGIVGEMTGKRLKTNPAQLESFANYKKRAPGGDVLVPNDPGMRRYGANPYAGYDTSPTPFLFQGDLPKGINPMVRVIVVDPGPESAAAQGKGQGHLRRSGVDLAGGAELGPRYPGHRPGPRCRQRGHPAHPGRPGGRQGPGRGLRRPSPSSTTPFSRAAKSTLIERRSATWAPPGGCRAFASRLYIADGEPNL